MTKIMNAKLPEEPEWAGWTGTSWKCR